MCRPVVLVLVSLLTLQSTTLSTSEKGRDRFVEAVTRGDIQGIKADLFLGPARRATDRTFIERLFRWLMGVFYA